MWYTCTRSVLALALTLGLSLSLRCSYRDRYVILLIERTNQRASRVVQEYMNAHVESYTGKCCMYMYGDYEKLENRGIASMTRLWYIYIYINIYMYGFGSEWRDGGGGADKIFSLCMRGARLVWAWYIHT